MHDSPEPLSQVVRANSAGAKPRFSIKQGQPRPASRLSCLVGTHFSFEQDKAVERILHIISRLSQPSGAGTPQPRLKVDGFIEFYDAPEVFRLRSRSGQGRCKHSQLRLCVAHIPPNS